MTPHYTLLPTPHRKLLQAQPVPERADWPQQFESLVKTLRMCTHPIKDQRQGHTERILRQRIREALVQLEELKDSLAVERQWREHLQSLLQAGAEREAHCRYRADHDALTDLPNRAAFMAQLHEILGQHPAAKGGDCGCALSVMMLDLDHFKPVNDQHGHAAGDQLLRIVGARLQHAVRAGDVVGRLGGDEFAILVLDGNSPTHLAHLAQKLRAAVAAPLQVGKDSVQVSASIGIARHPEDGTDGDTLLAAADAAMYSAKRNGAGHAFATRSEGG